MAKRVKPGMGTRIGRSDLPLANEVEGPAGEILIYQTEDGRTRVECRFADETLWLSQALMAELFQTSSQNITQHLRALYQEGEIEERATCKQYLQVRQEGNRQFRRSPPAAADLGTADLVARQLDLAPVFAPVLAESALVPERRLIGLPWHREAEHQDLVT